MDRQRMESLSANDANFEAIYKELNESVFRVANNILKNTEEAQEVTADCFVSLWHQLRMNAKIDNLRPYILQSARNKSLNKLEERKNEPTYSPVDIAALPDLPDQQFQLHIELMDQVVQYIEQMPKKRRQIAKMTLLYGMRDDEAATNLRVTKRTVINQRNTALSFLRKVIFGEPADNSSRSAIPN